MTGAYIVERTPDNFETVNAFSYRIDHGGTLVFKDEEGKLFMGFAPGTWLTFYYDQDHYRESSTKMTTANEDAREAIRKRGQ